MPSIQFTVYGVAAPQGSKRAFVNPRTGRAILTEDNKRTKPWRNLVSAEAVASMGDKPPHQGGVYVNVLFMRSRPKSHINSKGQIRKSAPYSPTTKPDIDKLVRAILDALTGIVFRDDSQVVSLTAKKCFGAIDRTIVSVSME